MEMEMGVGVEMAMEMENGKEFSSLLFFKFRVLAAGYPH